MLPHNYREDDDYGIRLDVLVEGRLYLEHAAYQLREMYVTLDSLADDPEIWSDDELAEIRSLQSAVTALAKKKDEDHEETAARLAEVREESPDR